MNRTHILIVNTDPLMNKLLEYLLREDGYHTTTLADPRGVSALLHEQGADLVLLDVLLPYIDGFTLCASLRRRYPRLSIIFLTARATVNDKVEGFTRGADDYLTKPFEPAELLARIQALLRRTSESERHRMGQRITVDECALDLGQLQFTTPTRPPVRLTPTEMKILECLMRNADVVIARERLIEWTWGYDYDGDSNRVEVYIGRLRRKIEANPIEPRYIHTVRGLGYMYRPRSERESPTELRLVRAYEPGEGHAGADSADCAGG